MAVSYIPDRGEDVEYAKALVGPDAKPTGRLRIVQETSQLQLQWQGVRGVVWLALPMVSQNDKPAIIMPVGQA